MQEVKGKSPASSNQGPIVSKSPNIEKCIGLSINGQEFDIGIFKSSLESAEYFKIRDNICFTDSEVIFEEEATEESQDFIQSFFTDYVQYIGIKEKSPKAKKLKENIHYKISSDFEGYLQYEFSTNRFKSMKLYPEQLLALILSYIKLGYGQGINKIIIGVDSLMPLKQQLLIYDAASIAGFTKIVLVPEIIAFSTNYIKTAQERITNLVVNHNNMFGHLTFSNNRLQLNSLAKNVQSYQKLTNKIIIGQPLHLNDKIKNHFETIQISGSIIEGILAFHALNIKASTNIEDEISLGLPNTGPLVYCCDSFVPFVIHNDLQIVVYTNEVEVCKFTIICPGDQNLVDIKAYIEDFSIIFETAFEDMDPAKQVFKISGHSQNEIEMMKHVNEQILADEGDESDDDGVESKLDDYIKAVDKLSAEKTKWGLDLKQKMTVSELLVKEKVDVNTIFHDKKMSQLDFSVRFARLEDSLKQIVPKYERPSNII
ncbi:hypothetical protein TVAG_233300 [Trichomonas vaginalis G3]|uniref:Uncharacterized protein n=1 Tax=Trichomonas vaginalis (strain ATCC PRA-98 / G3) TaxID=412133 RepID=A2ERZ9_TRIV3|nr:hypothetical protein TVAGG3_0486860 [Trichomonas vaginalis G3]EAY04594.1 hypothetical protein TVAG_233300 [Trichomonas vaginalis G3]KAI5516094.1 hypothetical protein TVAGG3_0486860 [Trichomonas vaginalis G3]|eukprot:XP_001316817.1 hypothetical protein [Trichomonas vaginalis G3]